MEADARAASPATRAAHRRFTAVRGRSSLPQPGESGGLWTGCERSQPMMWWDGGGPGWFGWLLMTMVMLAFWGLLVFGAVAVYRNYRRDGARVPPTGGDDPVQLLEERFARGEIDSDEFCSRCSSASGTRTRP